MEFLKEPLLHFLIAGSALFATYIWLNQDTDDPAWSGSRTVHITAAEVEWLQQTWALQWQRPPSEDELKGLVADHLKETLLVQEALALGLDENDTVVRRRLAQKMAFLVADTAQLAEPDEDELQRFYQTHHERFQAPARVSFTHVYFNRDQHGAQAEADAQAALRQLSQTEATASTTNFGDRFLVGYDFIDADKAEVASLFGPDFASRVFALEPGPWQGPITSGFGLHLVRVANKQAAQLRELAAVRGEVLKLWQEQREQERHAQYFAALLEKYDVVVDESIKPLVGPLVSAKEQAR
ncbi:MAG: peptidyl-prolyl cis-trans isomerase [Candidatus Competibacteraceae bacterium]|nr:peptidyl-prolyl cis-trans isomerase [Candidatus Competibacteraceae bacterium]